MPKGDFILTQIIHKSPEGGFIGFIEEIPGINTQGETKEEVQKNLDDALNLVLDITNINREIEEVDNMIQLHSSNSSKFMLEQYQAKKEKLLDKILVKKMEMALKSGFISDSEKETFLNNML